MENLKIIEKVLIQKSLNMKKENSKDIKNFIKQHYNKCLSLILPVISNKKIIINEYKYNILIHLFNLSLEIKYIPSIFIKEIAEMNSFEEIEIVGIFTDMKRSKDSYFLSLYYKVISAIMNNKMIKEEKKKKFDDIISEKLNEKTALFLLNLFNQKNAIIDEKTKTQLKAITQDGFEFGTKSAENFKKVLCDLIKSNKNKNWINKYVFKIIEKCLLKLKKIEPEFIKNLSELCHSIVDLFLQKKNLQIKKLFRHSIRIIYIIYNKRNEKSSKIIKFFDIKVRPLLAMKDTNENLKNYITEVIYDFTEVNFNILKCNEDLIYYYRYFYDLIIKTQNEFEKELYITSFENIYLYETNINKYINQSNLSYMNQILTDFSKVSSNNKNKIAIYLICHMLKKLPCNLKLKIIDKITFNNFSYFYELNTTQSLIDILNALSENIKDNLEIEKYYIKYLDLLFKHIINNKKQLSEFFKLLDYFSYNKKKQFDLSLKYAKKLFDFLEEANLFFQSDQPNKKKIEGNLNNSIFRKEINYEYDGIIFNNIILHFLKLLAYSSIYLDKFDENKYQEVMDIYIYIIIFKLPFLHKTHLTYKYQFTIEMLQNNKEDTEFLIYLLIFSNNLPCFIYNKNTFLTDPIKVNIKTSILQNAKSYLLTNELEDFGVDSNMSIENILYIHIIYYQFISKYVFTNMIFNNDSSSKQNFNIFSKYMKEEDIYNIKISVINLLNYSSDNLFINDSNLKSIFDKMFDKYQSKTFELLKKCFNTKFKEKIISNDLKLLLNFACYNVKDISTKAIHLIKNYGKYFPFLLNEYEIFEYYVNILGMLINKTIQQYDFFIKEESIETNLIPLEMSSNKKQISETYKKLNKIFEKNLQKSYMINNNNITFNLSNYMNHYTINSVGRNESMNYSVNLLQKIYNNIKKIEIPPTLKTDAYLDPEKFQEYLKTHIKKNKDKYLTLANVNDIYSPGDYTKSTKLQLRNKYIGIVEGKMNNLKNESENDDNVCYDKFINEIQNNLTTCIKESNNINDLTVNISSIMIELSAFIVYLDRKEFNPKFNKQIPKDEILNIITSISMLLYNANCYESICFCWEWILYSKHETINIILDNIKSCILNKKVYFKLTKKYKKEKSSIFNLINTLNDSITKANEDFQIKRPKNLEEANKNDLKKRDIIYIFDHNLQKKCENTDLDEYINSRIILLKFIKECMKEFCKCDMENLISIYQIMKVLISQNIDENLFDIPIYVYLHFLILNISLDLLDIFSHRPSLFNFTSEELEKFKIETLIFGLRYFFFDNKRRLITNQFLLQETQQTMSNCNELLKKDDNKTQEINLDNGKNVFILFNDILTNYDRKENKVARLTYEDFEVILMFLIQSDLDRLKYWNNPSAKHTSSGINESQKHIFNNILNYSDKLSIKLIQRFPKIKKMFRDIVLKIGERIYSNKKLFYNEPYAINLMIEYLIDKNKNELNTGCIIKDLLCWKFPLLNFALQFISLDYDNLLILHKYCLYLLDHADKSAIIFYLPQLIQSLRTLTNFQVGNFILRKCKQSSMISHQFLWALKVEEVMCPKIKKRYLPKDYKETSDNSLTCKILRNKILKNMNYIKKKFWYEEDKILTDILDVSSFFLHPTDEYRNKTIKQMTKEEKNNIIRKKLKEFQGKILPYIYLPTNPNYKLSNIDPLSAVSLQSAKKVPFIVSFEATEYDGPDEENLINTMSFSDFIRFEYKNLKTFQKSEVSSLLMSMLNSNKTNYENNFNLAKTKNFPNNSSFNNYKNNQIKNNGNNNQISNTLYYFGSEKVKSINFSDSDISDDGDINIQFSLEKKNSDNIYIPLLETRAFNNRPEESKLTHDKIKTNLLNNGVNKLSKEDKQIKIDFLDNCTISSKDSESFLDKSNISLKENEDDKTNGISKVDNINKKIYISCIFKVGDDLRQDSLALQVIQIFQEIFNQSGLPLYTYPYQTISTISPQYNDLGGYIEVVKDTDSRDQIGKTYDTDLYNYYLCSFGQENSNKFRNARKNLIESLAGYAIISYILQIKDRHNGNILVDNSGHLIHIDFGFIFDISPAGNMKFEKAEFKLTQEMIKIMGGTESESYNTFVDLTVKAFLACRDNMNKLLDPVVLMFSSGLECFREKSISRFIERFKLDLDEEEAVSFMKDVIKQAEDNWRTSVYDWIQKKQNNIYY